MRKRVTNRKKQKEVIQKKTVRHYLQFYLLSIAVAVIAFSGSSFFFFSQSTCANSHSCKSDLTEKIENNAIGYYQGHQVIPPKIDVTKDLLNPSVLGTNDPNEPKHIYIDLSTQQLYGMEGTTKVMQMLISSGKWNPTPVGNFAIWTKLRATRMSGGEGADAYDLPNVPYTMYFYHDFGLHGAYWHDNFGHKMSHGCVNLRIVDARDLFLWAEVGTPVSVCKQFTQPDKCIQK